MKRYVLVSVLMAMFVSTAAFSQRPGEFRDRPQENMEREMRQHHMQLELQEREVRMNSEREIQELERKERRIELEGREVESGFHRRMQEIELEQRSVELERQREAQERAANFGHHRKGAMLPFLIVCFVVHILVAVWVYKDIRRRNSGSGIWIVVALLTGLLGVLVYAIVRLGNTRQTKP